MTTTPPAFSFTRSSSSRPSSLSGLSAFRPSSSLGASPPFTFGSPPSRSLAPRPSPLRPSSSSGTDVFTAYGERGTPAASTPSQPDTGVREWTFVGLEWVIKDVREIQEEVQVGEDENEGRRKACESGGALPQPCFFGDGKWRLELLRNSATTSTSPSPSNLVLCLTSLTLDYAPADYSIEVSCMVGVKVPSTPPSRRGEWVWREWETGFVFQRDQEVWECRTLPPLPTLLSNPRISASNSFTLIVQIHSPLSPPFPELPSVHYVPRSLLAGLESSLDNPATSDVRILCFEAHPTNPALRRRRAIYANSDILKRRSEYFATMLEGEFAEAVGRREGRWQEVRVEDAEWATVYWVIRFLYTDEIEFSPLTSPSPSSSLTLDLPPTLPAAPTSTFSEWAWHDPLSLLPPPPAPAPASAAKTPARKPESQLSATTSSHARGVSSGRATPEMLASLAITKSNPTSPVTTTTTTTAASTSSAPPKPSSIPVPSRNPSPPPAPAAAVNPSADPHAHHTAAPPPPSALDVYRIAHRYALPALAQTALEHVGAGLTPRNAFAVLLATCMFDELHDAVREYVMREWEDVAGQEAFEDACKEVANGEWGEAGGKVLASFFRRLQSPLGRHGA